MTEHTSQGRISKWVQEMRGQRGTRATDRFLVRIKQTQCVKAVLTSRGCRTRWRKRRANKDRKRDTFRYALFLKPVCRQAS